MLLRVLGRMNHVKAPQAGILQPGQQGVNSDRFGGHWEEHRPNRQASAQKPSAGWSKYAQETPSASLASSLPKRQSEHRLEANMGSQ